MKGSAPQDMVQGFLHGKMTRRDLIQRLTALGLSMPAIGAILSVCSSQASPALAEAPPGADVEAAKKEGRVVMWHTDMQAGVSKFGNLFSDKYGIKTESDRLLPGRALPKLEVGLKSGTLDLDVWWISDAGIMYDQQKKGRLLRYVSPQMQAYAAEFKSNPEGYWTGYLVDTPAIMYSPKFVKKEEAPKTYLDLLDPKWKGQLGCKPSSSGSEYAWWYLVRQVVPEDYFDRLAKNQPRPYDATDQMMDDLQRGEIKIGTCVSIFQYVVALRNKQPVELVLPPEGTPCSLEVVGISASTKRPNAAKLFIDYFLSQEGQQAWTNMYGSYSARKDCSNKELPSLATVKLLQPKDMEDYASPTRHQEFIKVWNQVTGFK